jgi:hypothetical protein
MLHPSRRFVLTLLAGSALAGKFAGTAAAETPVVPVNQATRDPALVKVIAALTAAAKAKNFKRLSQHVSERIELDYGGGRGRAEFGRRLAKGPKFWDEVVWVLEHGGRFAKDGSFWAPYTYDAEIGNLDVFEAGVVLAKVKAHAEPRANAPMVAELDRSVVKVTDWKRTKTTPSPFYRRRDWVQIELEDKRKAWLQAKHVRSVVDFRAGFNKMRGVWKMTAFIAGD